MAQSANEQASGLHRDAIADLDFKQRLEIRRQVLI
jgi:hypothetical protein